MAVSKYLVQSKQSPQKTNPRILEQIQKWMVKPFQKYRYHVSPQYDFAGSFDVKDFTKWKMHQDIGCTISLLCQVFPRHSRGSAACYHVRKLLPCSPCSASQGVMSHTNREPCIFTPGNSRKMTILCLRKSQEVYSFNYFNSRRNFGLDSNQPHFGEIYA